MKSGILVGLTAALLVSTAARADVEINNKPTSNMSCDSGVCTATAPKAVLNVSDLATMLASGDVAVKTGLVAKDIDIDQPLQWTSTSRLTLDAQQSVTVEKQVTVAGQGALTVVTNDTGGTKGKTKTGEFIIVPEHGSVQFWDKGSSLIIDGNSYTLVSNIKTLASDIAANPSGFYALAKPYDASKDGTYNSSPIRSSAFQGVLEGLGNEISNFSMDAPGPTLTGLIAATGDGSAIRHLGITKAQLQARSDNLVALLVGNNASQITRCWTGGKIRAFGGVAGGLVATNAGTISHSYSNVRIEGSDEEIGGLTGYNNGTIGTSYALGSVVLRSSSQAYVGGLVGENQGDIQDSFARNRVKNGRKNNNSYFGGLVGENESGAQIQNSYAAGEISPYSSSGGLVGFDAAAAGSISESYWDLDMGVSDPSQGAANIENDPGITGLTTLQFQAGLPHGFSPKIWAQDQKTNDGFPYLVAVPPK